MTLAEMFDQIDWGTIQSYVALRQEENLHLEFKTMNNSELTAKEDKRNFARGVSGFANSSGGIIVWGIDARANADGIDCASAIVELKKPELVVGRLNTITGDASSPLVDGIRHKAIINPESESGTGVVATLVPESELGPHMAMLGEQRYFKRSGDSFYPMEHFDLEDMFGRRRKPLLRMSLAPTHEDGATKLVVRLKNVGRRTARHAGFMLKFENAEIVSLGGDLRNISHLNSDRPVVTFDYPSGVIHPNGIDLIAGEARRCAISIPSPQTKPRLSRSSA